MIKAIAKSVIPQAAWMKLSFLRAGAERTMRRAGRGAGATLLIVPLLDRASKSLPLRPKWVRPLKLKGYRYPIHYRTCSSDLDVIHQVFIRGEYECVARETDVSLIVDCGANIGCTSFFFLHRYPEARVIAVEPDPHNFAMCRRNLEPFGDRVELVNSGVWPTTTPLCVERGSNRDGREWSFQVRPARGGERPHLMGSTIGDLIGHCGSRTIDLLKIDIESAEIALFSEGTDHWLPQTRCIAIELHGPDCERAFFRAVTEDCWSFESSGESTIARNRGSEASRGAVVGRVSTS